MDCQAGSVVTCASSHREDSGVRCLARTGNCYALPGLIAMCRDGVDSYHR